MSADDLTTRARDFLARALLFDGHNDLAYVIREDARWAGDVAAFRAEEDAPGRDTDLAKLARGGVAAQFFAAYVPPHEPRPASYALQQIALIARLEALHPDRLMPARRAADVATARAQGKIASFTTIENGAALEGRIDALDAYFALGVRLMTLCHNAANEICDSATAAPVHGGLTAFGRSVVQRMNRLGMIVDLAHVAPSAMRDVLDATDVPPAWSHSNARKLCAHPRNVPEDVLDRVARHGGIVMATFVPDFISEASRRWGAALRDEWGSAREDITDFGAALEARAAEAGPWPMGELYGYCDHLDYLRGRIGADHIGVGSDFYGGPQGPGLEDASCFPAVFAELMARGWSEGDLEKLAGANILRVMRQVEAAAA